jgi:hypothetical protein
MSDIQDLIHKTSMDCIERGKIVERERIVKLVIEYFPPCYCNQYEPPRICIHRDIAQELSALIKGDTNATI